MASEPVSHSSDSDVKFLSSSKGGMTADLVSTSSRDGGVALKRRCGLFVNSSEDACQS